MDKQLQEAIDNLSLSDVYPVKINTDISKGFHPKFSKANELIIRFKNNVSHFAVAELASDDTNENTNNILQVYIEYGVRWYEKEEEIKDDNYCATAEVTFSVEYIIQKELSEECLKKFAIENSQYHSWPYCRELISNLTSRMNLPKVVLPLVQLQHHRFVSDSEDECE